MNGFTAAAGLFAKMTLFHWVGMIVLVVTLIGTGVLAYNQIDENAIDIEVNATDIEENTTSIDEMHDTQLLLIEEVQDLNEGIATLNTTMQMWLGKIYELEVESEATQ